MGALPKALSRRGHRVMAVAPRYSDYREGWETGIRVRLRVFNQEHEVEIPFSGFAMVKDTPYVVISGLCGPFRPLNQL